MSRWHVDPRDFRVHRREEKRRVARLVEQFTPRTWSERYPDDVRSDVGGRHVKPRTWLGRYARAHLRTKTISGNFNLAADAAQPGEAW